MGGDAQAQQQASNPPPTSDDYDDWTVDQLKLECMARQFNLAKNTKKSVRVEILNSYDRNKDAVEMLVDNQRSQVRKPGRSGDDDEDDRRTPHCIIRLINVLFSDAYFNAFMSSGDRLTRPQLDEGGLAFGRTSPLRSAQAAQRSMT